jgi:signal transduction histidine kinase/CHASE1-domain containing sensor protein
MNLARRTPLLILGVSLLVTAIATASVADLLETRELIRFQNASQGARDRVTGRLGIYLALLRSTQAYFAADAPVSVAEFHVYAQRLDLSGVYSGLQGIGFAERLHAGLPEVPTTPGAEATPVWPRPGPGMRTAVVMLEPGNARNRAALGYDMATDPTRREAMERARDSGQPAMTGRVVLVQEIEGPQQPGFLLYLPVYRGGITPQTVNARREALAGFVYAPFRAGDVFEHLFGSEVRPRVAVAVYDGPVAPPNLLYDGRLAQRQPLSRAAHVEDETLVIGGRSWTVRVSSLPVFIQGTSPWWPAGMGLGGVLVSLALFGIALGQSRARQEAEEERRTALTLMRLGMAFASELEPERLIQGITDQATQLTGAAFGGYFHNIRDAEGRFSLYALSGASREDFRGMPNLRPTPLFAPLFEGRVPIRMADVTQSERFGKNPPYHGMPEGHPKVRSFLGVPVKGRSGGVIGALIFGHPEPGRFTEQHERRIEALAAHAAVALDNARLYQEAREAVRVRDEFLSVASHELKTPLTPLTLKLEVLERRMRAEAGEDPERRRNVETLEVAMRQVRRLGRLVTDLLDVTRITAGRMRLERAPMELGELVEEVVARFEPQAQRAGSALSLGGDGAVAGEWDRERLDQVLGILVENALKYGAGKPVEVRVGRGEHGVARLEVVDHGIGVQPEDVSRIFERFVRAVSERNYGGLGLGLYIARQIVEAHGGRLEVESDPGRRTVFRVDLPSAAASSASPSASPSPSPSPSPLPPGEGQGEGIRH